MHIVARIGGVLGVTRRSPRFLLQPPVKKLVPQRFSITTSILTTSRAALPRVEGYLRREGHNSISTSANMDLNGEVRHKRKTSPVNIHDRPAKVLRPELSNGANGEVMVEDEVEYMEGDAMVQPITATVDTAEWQATIEQVVKNVVSIHFCQTCSFDTDPAMSSEATGFVVDAEKGYILTNRHVVGAGPFWGYCIFDNHEEVIDQWVFHL